jgi:hypothetical protein
MTGVCASSGIGPTTDGRAPDRSTKTKGLPFGRPFVIGAAGRIRTHDPLVRSQVLYPTELRALELINFCFRELRGNYIRLIESEVKELEHADKAPLIFRIADRRAGKWEEFKAVNLILPIRNFFPLAPALS